MPEEGRGSPGETLVFDDLQYIQTMEHNRLERDYGGRSVKAAALHKHHGDIEQSDEKEKYGLADQIICVLRNF